MEDSVTVISSRPAAREFVFGLLFAKAFAPGEDPDHVWNVETLNAGLEAGEQGDYIRRVFFGVTDGLAGIDEKIEKAAVGWALSRLSRTTLTIMRLCVFEMTSVDDVPKRVALNEAVELAKKYDDDNAPGFINGVLNAIAKTLPDRPCDQ